MAYRFSLLLSLFILLTSTSHVIAQDIIVDDIGPLPTTTEIEEQEDPLSSEDNKEEPLDMLNEAEVIESEALENDTEQAQEEPLGNIGVLQVLNKITARNKIIELRAGSPESFGNLKLVLRDCWKAPPEEKPEATVLLEVWDGKPGEEKQRIFYGWMFASSPALSALEHPVYDIVVLDCIPWKPNQ